MNIADNLYVAFDYNLTLDSGEEIDSSSEREPLGFITGSGQIIPGLEKAMMGKTVGDNFKISFEPEDAYGPVNPELFKEIPRKQFPGNIELQPGMTFRAETPHGPVLVNIKEIKDENTVIVDLNHALAGKRLHFDITIVEVREPTSEELCGSSAAGNCACSAEEKAGCETKGGC